MGRPAKVESEKLRSFSVRLAPRDMGRALNVIAKIKGLEVQELLRRYLEDPIDEAYDAVTEDTDLPSRSRLALLSEEEYRRVLRAAEGRAAVRKETPRRRMRMPGEPVTA